MFSFTYVSDETFHIAVSVCTERHLDSAMCILTLIVATITRNRDSRVTSVNKLINRTKNLLLNDL
jgi:hypothetical protein